MLLRAALVAFLVMTACDSGGASTSETPAASRPASRTTPEVELRSVLDGYFDCLGEQGIELSEPTYDESGAVRSWPTYVVDDDARAAEERCSDDLSEIAFRPRGEAAIFLERAGQFADCMAANGVPDVEVSLEGIRIGPRSRNREIRSAERECRHFMEEG